MGDAGCFDDACAFEPDLRIREVVEEPRTASEEDGDEVDLHFVDQPGFQVLLGDVRATAKGDVLAVGRFPGMFEGGLDPVGDKG